MKYKTLEQQIQELWGSRGMEVVSETFRVLGDGTLEWVIKAKVKEKM